ncbi:hypothetical protein GCM10017562_04460 [Streptomyces roseofulvus]
MAAIIPPRRLGTYAGVFGAVFAVGTVAGPLIGGVLVDTSWLGWRWCFFIGVPFALVAIVLLQRTLKLPDLRREAKIDYLGTFLIATPFAALALLAVLFVKEKPLKTTSGMQRLAENPATVATPPFKGMPRLRATPLPRATRPGPSPTPRRSR